MDLIMDFQYATLKQKLAELDPRDPQLVLLGVAVALLFAVVLFRILCGGKRGRSFLLVGPSGSGKSSLFMQLKLGAVPKLGTVTSMTENEGTFPVFGTKGPAVHLVDLPGHPRLRTRLDHHVSTARAVLFLIDAVDFMSIARITAEIIYEVLSKPALQKKRVPVLFVCNKMDRTSAHSIDFIRKRLEKEIEQSRTTRSALRDTKDSDTGGLHLTKKNVPFAFSICTNPIMFCGTSVINGDIAAVKDFIKNNA